jgi:hypothetical protein
MRFLRSEVGASATTRKSARYTRSTTSVGTLMPSTGMVSGIGVVSIAANASGSAFVATVNWIATSLVALRPRILYPTPMDEILGSRRYPGPRARMNRRSEACNSARYSTDNCVVSLCMLTIARSFHGNQSPPLCQSSRRRQR